MIYPLLVQYEFFWGCLHPNPRQTWWVFKVNKDNRFEATGSILAFQRFKSLSKGVKNTEYGWLIDVHGDVNHPTS